MESGFVTEPDLFIHNVAANGRGQHTTPITAFLGGIQNVEDARCGSSGGLKHLVQSVQTADRFVEKHSRIQHEREKFAHAHRALHDLRATDPKDKPDAQSADEL